MLNYNALAIFEESILELKRKIDSQKSKYYNRDYKYWYDLIERLWEIHDSITQLILYDVWMVLEKQLLNAEKQDPEINGAIIHLQRRKGNFNPVFINLLNDKL